MEADHILPRGSIDPFMKNQPSLIPQVLQSNQSSLRFKDSNIEKMTLLPGGCYCGAVRYSINLDDPQNNARTSICHCQNCKRFTGCNYGVTTKIPKSSFSVSQGQDAIKVHEADNGSGVLLHREFCNTCGGSLLEYGVSPCQSRHLAQATQADQSMFQGQRRRLDLCLLRHGGRPGERPGETQGRVFLSEPRCLDAASPWSVLGGTECQRRIWSIFC
jgi:hypothetical protein